MTLDDLQTLLDFHYWARDRVLDAVDALTDEQYTRDLGSSFESVRDTLVHLLSAESAWYQRWQGMSPTGHLAADRFPDVASLRAAWVEHEGKMRMFLASLGETDVARGYDYKSLAGQPSRSSLAQMLQQVVNHGTYHRGQVTTLLRQLGATPAKSVDLIAFYRERFNLS